MAKTTNNQFRHRGRDQNTAYSADQAEFASIKRGSMVIDEGIYDERVASSLDDFDPGDIDSHERWHQEDLKYDTAVGAINEEVERRSEIMGAAYPFRLNGGSLIYQPSKNLLYEFLLSVCLSPSITKGKFVNLPRLFERISAKIVAASFGASTQSIHVGSPRDTDIGTSFKEAMEYVSNKTGEWNWGPEDGLDSSHIKDEGVDYIVWPKDWDGRKLAQIFIVGQCACGNDWDTKYDDLNIQKLRKWFHPLSIIEPYRTFTVPYQVVDSKLKEASREAGYIYDRARLVLIERDNEKPILSAGICNQMTELISLVKNA